MLGLTAAAFLIAGPGTASAVPFAGFTFAPEAPLTHQSVTFRSAATTDPGATIVSEEWDLDDDGEFDDGAGPTASFVYLRPGPRRAQLRIVDSEGNKDTHREHVVVGNRAPVASFLPVPADQAPGKPVTLYSNSYDPDGFIVSYAWDLDLDGAFDDAAGSSAVLTVPPGGTYTAGLRVTDDSGASSTLALTRSRGSPLGGSSLRLMSPFPVVRVSGVLKRRGIKLRLLSVSAPAGATVRVRCNGRGCAFRARTKTVGTRTLRKPGRAGTSAVVRIRRLGRRVLQVGTTVRVYVTSPSSVGKYTRLRVRRGKPPARIDRCVLPSAERPAACPSG
jgi:PKD domain